MAIVTTEDAIRLRTGAREGISLICSVGSRTLASAGMLPPATARLKVIAQTTPFRILIVIIISLSASMKYGHVTCATHDSLSAWEELPRMFWLHAKHVIQWGERRASGAGGHGARPIVRSDDVLRFKLLSPRLPATLS